MLREAVPRDVISRGVMPREKADASAHHVCDLRISA